MKEVAVYEAKTRLSELLVEVEGGEQFTITRRGLPVARLVAVGPPKSAAHSQRKQVLAVFSQLVQQRRGVVMEGNTKDWVADGRD